MDTLIVWAEEKRSISPTEWLDAAQKINVMLSRDSDRLLEMQNELAKKKVELLSEPDAKVNKVNIMIEAMPEYLEMKKVEAFIKRAEETGRMAKQRSKAAETEMRGY